MYICTVCLFSIYEGQKRVLGFLGLELQMVRAVMCVLRIKHGVSGRVSSLLLCVRLCPQLVLRSEGDFGL